MKNGKKYIIKFSRMADKDRLKLKSAGLDKICKNTLELMSDNPFCYPPSYEKSCGELCGYYSRRINRQHRIVYRVNEEEKIIYIIRMWTHYEKL